MNNLRDAAQAALKDKIGEYWDIGYEEGSRGLSHGDRANRKLAEVNEAIRDLIAAAKPTDDGLLHDRIHVDSPNVRAAKSVKHEQTAQPVAKQEPICILTVDPLGRQFLFDKVYPLPPGEYPLFTHPAPIGDLSDKEIFAVENAVPDEVIGDSAWTIYFARAILEAARNKTAATVGVDNFDTLVALVQEQRKAIDDLRDMLLRDMTGEEIRHVWEQTAAFYDRRAVGFEEHFAQAIIKAARGKK